jgi:gliding motility-associated-like protein
LKRLFFLVFFSFALSAAFANHIKGGFFTYTYLGQGSDASKSRYDIILTVYMECKDGAPSPGQLNNPINFSFFNAGTGAFVKNESVSITNQYVISKTKEDDCITGDQRECYYTIVEYALRDVELTNLTNGYIISYQRCCRIKDIVNIAGSSQDVGNTYSIAIPGTNQNAYTNSSARFQINDTVVICGGSFFRYSFQATDPNPGDSLSYYFCDAWSGGSTGNAAPTTAQPPSNLNPIGYPVIPYATGFSGGAPLGSQVTINPVTGLISGIAPANSTGLSQEYVITVCVDEFRSGVKIASTRKELHVKVGSCNVISATLNPEYVNCDTTLVSFFNKTPIGVISHFWDFGVTTLTTDTSTQAAPSYNYPDTGVYIVKYKVESGAGCADSTTAVVRVFPGFNPGFIINGVCTNKPTQFFDTTKTKYGVVNSWSWDFGESTVTNDNSNLQNPVYTYPQSGTKPVTFIVGSSKGCRDTVLKNILIQDKPPLDFRFRDTLICNGDTLQLHGLGNGNFSWTPNANMFNPNTADPTVFPSVTTVYTAKLDDNGCINTDTVRVRVVNFVTLIGRPDTTICLTDSVQLGVTFTNALRFQWTPTTNITDPTVLNAIAHPTAPSQSYHLIARIGHCIAEDDLGVFTIPYPTSYAGVDTNICYDTDAFLHGSVNATNFIWAPANTLNNPATPDPIAHPLDTTAYILTAISPLSGCPKPVRDTVIVNVLPRILAFAGRDTSVILNQPLQFNATGGTSYIWSPATGLSNPNIPNPIGIYTNSDFDRIKYKVHVFNAAGCEDSAYVTVKIFRLPAQVLVPTAFTPNSDGNNDLFRPVAIGITKILYFRVFNRWGELVFTTTQNNFGWDGKINGKEQGTGVFVWVVKAVDYTGKDFFAKGTVTLIR